jgi:hypothetical protein
MARVCKEAEWKFQQGVKKWKAEEVSDHQCHAGAKLTPQLGEEGYHQSGGVDCHVRRCCWEHLRESVLPNLVH